LGTLSCSGRRRIGAQNTVERSRRSRGGGAVAQSVGRSASRSSSFEGPNGIVDVDSTISRCSPRDCVGNSTGPTLGAT